MAPSSFFFSNIGCLGLGVSQFEVEILCISSPLFLSKDHRYLHWPEHIENRSIDPKPGSCRRLKIFLKEHSTNARPYNPNNVRLANMV